MREKPTGEKFTQAVKQVEYCVSAIGKNDKVFKAKYSDFKGSLYDRGLKAGYDFNAYFMGYMRFSLKTGEPIMTSGELGVIANAKKSWDYPIVPAFPSIVATFAIKGSFEAGFKLIRQESGTINLGGHLKFEVEPRLGVGLNVLIAKAYAGIGGKMECSLEFPVVSFAQNFEATLSAFVYVEYDALFWGGDDASWTFAQTQLYPRGPAQQALSISPHNLNFIKSLPQARSTRSTPPDIFQDNMQVYAKPQIISLSNGNMFMTYIDDSADRTEENRTILMYSIYDGTEWSVPQPIADDGTVDFEPMICSDGNGGAHIVWQNGTTTFEDGVTLDEMAAELDLSYIHWNGSSFDNTTAITSNNQNFEMGYKIASSGNNIAVVWKENSENDPFALTGTNSLFRKQFSNPSWQSTETLASELSVVVSMDTSYSSSDNVVAYAAKSSDDNSTINDIEIYYVNDSTTTRLTDNDVIDYSLSFLGEDLYWISDNSVVTITDGDIDSREVVLENMGVSMSEFQVIGNTNGGKSIVLKEESSSGTAFFATYYDETTDSFGTIEPLVASNGVVRGWDACLQPNGKIEMSYCYADYLDEPVNGKPYGTLSLIQKSVNSFYDITVDPIAIYDGDILANGEITLLADIYNTGSQPASQFEVSVFDEGSNVIQTLIVDQSLAVGESGELEIPFTLPSSILRTDYRLQILPVGGEDISLSDNEAIFSIGFADLIVENVQEVRSGADPQITATVKNQGFDTVSAADLKLLKESSDGEMLGSKTITQLAPGAETTLTFDLDKNDLDASVSEDPRLFYLSLETEHEESDYGNNSETIAVYPDYPVTLTAGTGGTVTGSGLYENGSIASIAAVPAPGYLFEGWYEDGQLLAGLPQACDLAVNWSRTLEARFKSTDLTISDINITGIHEARKNLTITAQTDGGAGNYKWSFYVYRDGELCYSKLDSDVNSLTYKPSLGGAYTFSVSAEDETGYIASDERQITVEPGLPFFKINRDKTLSLRSEIPSDVKILYWESDNEKVATVDDNGIVSGKRVGTTIITAKASNGQKFSWEVEVDYTWWQILFIFFGFGVFLLPFWVA